MPAAELFGEVFGRLADDLQAAHEGALQCWIGEKPVPIQAPCRAFQVVRLVKHVLDVSDLIQ